MRRFELGKFFVTGFVLTGVVYGIMYAIMPRNESKRPPESLGQQLNNRDFTQ